MTGIAVGITLEVVLVIGLGFPEVAGWRNLGHHLARPQPRSIDIGDHVLGDPLLFIARVKDCRSITLADVVALSISRAGIMDLKEEFENSAIAHFGGIKDDLDRFGMTSVIAIGCIGHLAARVANPRRHDAVVTAEKILHSPEAAPGKNRTFLTHRISST